MKQTKKSDFFSAYRLHSEIRNMTCLRYRLLNFLTLVGLDKAYGLLYLGNTTLILTAP